MGDDVQSDTMFCHKAVFYYVPFPSIRNLSINDTPYLHPHLPTDASGPADIIAVKEMLSSYLVIGSCVHISMNIYAHFMYSTVQW